MLTNLESKGKNKKKAKKGNKKEKNERKRKKRVKNKTEIKINGIWVRAWLLGGALCVI